ncbi:MAG TPA: DUF1016 N-terminal domain-containing protein [Polyangia bacterium]|jgi:hypothetical protein
MKKAHGSIARAAGGYDVVLADVVRLIEDARRAAARSVNTVMTMAYWEIGRRLVEQKQGGARRPTVHGGRTCRA